MVKLYNKTHCPDNLLKRLLTAAGRRVGARTQKVVVKVTQGTRPFRVYGQAHNGEPYLWYLTSKRKGVPQEKGIVTDVGWMEIRLPESRFDDDHLDRAERIFRLLLHEWGHIKDMQDDWDGKTLHNWEYKQHHDNRPQERRANRMMDEALEKSYSPTAESAILELAVWLEEKAKGE